MSRRRLGYGRRLGTILAGVTLSGIFLIYFVIVPVALPASRLEFLGLPIISDSNYPIRPLGGGKVSSQGAVVTLIGVYQVAPNPCLDSLCPPGMVVVLESGDQTYFLASLDSTEYGHWIWDLTKTWPPNGENPQIGAAVQVTGMLKQRVDVNGNTFLEIEVQSLHVLPSSS
jgi:hypothetical protein